MDWSHVITGEMVERVRERYGAGWLPEELADREGCPLQLIEMIVYPMSRVD
jgi:hypothetical protein